MGTIKCFMLDRTDQAWRWLRRYSAAPASCGKPNRPHDAMVRIEDGPLFEKIDEKGRGSVWTDPMAWPREDPRWPKACACGHQFLEEDHWQLFYLPVYRRRDTGELFHIHPNEAIEGRAPAGAMWYADWLPWRGPDGHCLVAQTPAGDWIVAGPATGGGHWTRTGEVPIITASPSIVVGDPMRYHGWLRNGELVEV